MNYFNKRDNEIAQHLRRLNEFADAVTNVALNLKMQADIIEGVCADPVGVRVQANNMMTKTKYLFDLMEEYKDLFNE